LFADNPRSSKTVAESLRTLANKINEEATAPTQDMFGPRPKRTLQQIIDEHSSLILGKYKFGKSKLREEYDFLKKNIKFLHINAASVAIKKVSWIDVGKFPQEYTVLHDLVFYQRVIMKWGILESKEVLGRYRIYYNRPKSEIRTNLVMEDFRTYEKSDLKFHIEKYPDLHVFYNSEVEHCSESLIRVATLINLLRKVVLSIMTTCRRLQAAFNNSGFPD
jgi:hypothetical protein